MSDDKPDSNQWICPDTPQVTRPMKYHAVVIIPNPTADTKGVQSLGGNLDTQIQWARGILPQCKDATEVVIYEIIERPVARVRRALLAEDPPTVEKL